MNGSVTIADDVGQPTRPTITPVRPPTRTIRPQPPTSTPPKPTQPSTPDAPVSPPPASSQPEAPPPKADSPTISPAIQLPALPEKAGTTSLLDEMYVPDEVLVIMTYNIKNRLEEVEREADISLLEITDLKTVGLLVGRYRIPEGRRLFETMDEITLLLEGMADERVFVQPNYYFEAQGVDEPLNYNMQAIRAYEAHRIATGKGVTIALLDTPVDTEHPAYRARVQEERGIIENEPPGAHGTALAGVIAGNGYGVAPDVKLISIPVCKKEKNRAPRTTSFLLARGLDLALQRGVKVINLSLGGPRDSFVGLLVDEALKRKTVIVAAAGNSGPKGKPPYPASHTGVIAVTAIDHRDRLDPRATRGPHVSLSAPGVDIITSAPGGRQQVSTGTSVAAAHVTGIVALIFEQWPDATSQFVKTLLESSAHDLGPSGKDPEYGAGRVDALRALERLIAEKKKAR
ncbi:MAG: S8 family serine peptidase [Nitrospirota bacterium]